MPRVLQPKERRPLYFPLERSGHIRLGYVVFFTPEYGRRSRNVLKKRRLIVVYDVDEGLFHRAGKRTIILAALCLSPEFFHYFRREHLKIISRSSSRSDARRIHQHELRNDLTVLCRNLYGHAPAERMSDDNRFFYAQGRHKLHNPSGVVADGQRTARVRRGAETVKIDQNVAIAPHLVCDK